MQGKPLNPLADTINKLRSDAEKAITKNPHLENIYSGSGTSELLHEVTVQHIELEMQNEQLRQYNDELEIERKKFTGLYNLAPVGYFILDVDGIITEVNQAGCMMLGLPKGRIVKRSLKSFIIDDNSETFTGFLESIQIFETKHSCELTFVKPGGKFYARVEGVVPAFEDSDSLCCYIAIIDITDQKNAKINEEIRVLSATITAQENERQNISEALHNSVGQLLYGVKLKIDQLGITELSYRDINRLIDQAIRETRNISFELAPSILKDFGISVTLEEMAKRLRNDRLSIQVTSELTTRPDLAVEVTVFRIIQELVNNSIKHGLASEITIAVKKLTGIIIEVTDNGSGFDDEYNKRSAKGSGLAAIRNRISLYQGEMRIESKPGAGTKIRITLMNQNR